MILLLAFIVRLGWALSRPVTDAALNQLPDQHDYLSLARSVLHGDGFIFRDPRFPDALKAFRTPGYPLFLALCGASARLARAIQALLDTSTILAIYCIAKRLVTSTAIPLVAAAIVAVSPFLVYFSSLLLTETLFTAMLAWAMFLLLQRNKLYWLLAGLLLTTSILVRPSGIGLPMIVGAAAVLVSQCNRFRSAGFQPGQSNAKDADAQKVKVLQQGLEGYGTEGVNPQPKHPYSMISLAKRAAVAVMVMLLLTLLTVLPWSFRNHAVLGRWIPLDTNSGFTFYDGFNPRATGASDQSFVKQMPRLQTMDELQRSDYLAGQARAYVLSHPGHVITLAFAKLARTWSPITLSSEFGQLRYQLIAGAFAIPFDLLVIAGLFSSEMSRGAKAFLLTPALYFSIVHALTVGSLRYRIPAEPPLAILAAVSLVNAAEKMRTRSNFETPAQVTD